MSKTETKQCSACLKEDIGPLPVFEFGKNTNSPDGLSRHCRAHAQKFNKEHRARHSETIKLQRRIAHRSGSVISVALRNWGLPPTPAGGEGLSSGPHHQPVKPDAQSFSSRQSL